MKYNQASTTSFILKLARVVERLAAHAQGKGYGASSINRENDLTHKLLGRRPIVVVDVGGNVEDYTAEVRRRNPDAEIYTFEPSSVNVQKLQNRFANDDKVNVVPCAVSDSPGLATLFADKAGSGLGSLTKRKLDHFNIDFDVKESVNVIRFEDFWRNKMGGRHIDIVKLDIEGHELSALGGFGEAIHDLPPPSRTS